MPTWVLVPRGTRPSVVLVRRRYDQFVVSECHSVLARHGWAVARTDEPCRAGSTRVVSEQPRQGEPVKLFTVLVACIVWCVSVPAWADKHLRIALFAFPLAGGNPFTGTAVPSVLTHPAIFDGLTYLNRAGELQPWLATQWQQEDTLTWTFNLRPDVKFSNGEKFDAFAVTAAFEFLLSSEVVPVGASREVEIVERVEVRDPLTVAFITKRPAPILPRRLVAAQFPAPAHWKSLGPVNFAMDPIGTGPFQVEDWQAGRIELSAYRNSWRPPKVDRLTLLRFGEQASRVQALQSGAADIAVSLSADDRDAIAAFGGTLIEACIPVWPPLCF